MENIPMLALFFLSTYKIHCGIIYQKDFGYVKL